jgi:pimeloyl-ACP methyl ester carboxylesterase
LRSILVSLWLVCSAWAAAASESPLSAPIDFEPCTLTGTGGNGALHAECAKWARPLDYERPEGEQIELFVARIRATGADPALDAMTVINGGPGGSSVDMLVDFIPALNAISLERDIVVIDQRGTGRSTPLVCENLSDSVDTPSPDEVERVTRECLDNLPHDPRYFSTSVAVRDLEALREALTYEQLNIYGVSYGTRVALHYLRRYPNSVRALVIDGVVPPTTVLGSNVSFNSQNTLQQVFERCAEDASCSERFPNLEAEFDELSARLKRQAIPMTLAHPVTGLSTDLELGYGHFAITIRLALYAPEFRSLIPLIVHEAAQNENYTPIAANALQLVHQLTTSLNYGMHNAVVCTEDAPFYDREAVDMPALEATYLGAEMYETLQSMCNVWPAGVIDPEFKQALTSDVPTLILSGELDPITPPRYGDEVLTGLSNALHIVGESQGHGILGRGCVPKLILDFIEAASTSELDTSCTGHLGSRPFFVDMMGPPP